MSWGTILVGVDAAPSGQAALAFTRAVAARTHSAYRIVHVVADPRATPTSEQDVRRMLGPAQADLVVRHGAPAAILASEAAQINAKLIVVGGKHHSLIGRWMTGSTALELVRHAAVPVLIVRGEPSGVGRVLAAVDLTGAAGSTIAEAERWAALWEAPLRVVHAIEPMVVVSEMAVPLDVGVERAREERDLAEQVWPLLGRSPAERVVRDGPAAGVLDQEVRDWGADLLVLGRHARGWLERVMLGSVTERLLEMLPTSILVVPDRREPRTGAAQG